MAKLFKKDSKDKLSSPESLDTLLQITNPRGWAILATIGVCLCGALIWSICGTIPYTISGEGILFNRMGLFSVQSNSSGVLENLYFDINDRVESGQVIARVAGAELYRKVVGAQNALTQLRRKYKSIQQFGDQDLLRRKQALKGQLNDAQFTIKATQAKIKRLQKRLKGQHELYKIGLITQNDVQSTQEQLDTAEETILKNTATVKQIQVQSDQVVNDLGQKLRDIELQITSSETNLKIAQTTYDVETRVVTPYGGSVVGLGVAEGERITSGGTILTLSLGAQDRAYLEVVLYYPAGQAKRIKRGMLVRVAPGTVKVEKYGYALGLVTDVADYPATPEEMQQVLKNEELVSGVQRLGATLEVRAALIPDPKTPSGFTWTSSKGPPIHIRAGTTCTAQVVIEKSPPIMLVVPMLKKFFLGVGDKG